ncbi:MAG: cytochrome b/b6 domain-containing protein [Alphaproteobacteria bacterium]
MNLLHRIRIYHAVLAVFALLSYITGEMGLIHAWLGYGVAMIIMLRIFWSLNGAQQLGLARFYPAFAGMNNQNFWQHPAISRILLLGIALSLTGATITGIAMDKGKTIGLVNNNGGLVQTAFAEDAYQQAEEGETEESMTSEWHELLANIMLAFVGMHVGYLVLCKRPLAKFMLFMRK